MLKLQVASLSAMNRCWSAPLLEKKHLLRAWNKGVPKNLAVDKFLEFLQAFVVDGLYILKVRRGCDNFKNDWRVKMHLVKAIIEPGIW